MIKSIILLLAFGTSCFVFYQSCGKPFELSLKEELSAMDLSSTPPSPSQTPNNSLGTVDSKASWKNFYAIAWEDTQQNHIKYAKQMGYDYIAIMGPPDSYNWNPERAGLKFYLVDPHFYAMHTEVDPYIYTETNHFYAQDDKNFINSHMVWKSNLAFPNNLASGWWDRPGIFRPMFDWQQQAVIDWVVERILVVAKSYENKSINFTFAGVFFDVPRLWGDFHTTVGYTNLANWTGVNSGLLHPGITHQYTTYPDGFAAFFKKLNTRMKQEFPNAKWIIEPGKIYNTDWQHADGWVEEVTGYWNNGVARADKDQLVPDFISQEFGGTGFVDEVRNFNSGMKITKDMVGSTAPGAATALQDKLLVAGKAGINGAWFNWAGRHGDMVSFRSIVDVAPKLKIIRCIPNWDNLNNVPLSNRSWNGSVYKSTMSYASSDVMYSRHWKTGKLFTVFINHSGVIKLNLDETVISVQRTDNFFKESGDGITDVMMTNSSSGQELRLKTTVSIPFDSKANESKGIGYIITTKIQ